MADEPITKFVHGPYKDLHVAQHEADLLVYEPITQWSVVELFGPQFSRPAPSGQGETWGTLFVVPTDRADEFAEFKGAEHHQVVDTYGYEQETAE
jgi:hypothetical protein